MATRLAITLGDPTGIGPEVALRAVAAELPADDTHYTLVGDAGLIRHWNRRLNLSLPLGDARLQLHDVPSPGLTSSLQPGAAEAARAAFAWLEAAAKLCLSGETHGVVTAPVNKEAIVRAGIPFVGQTEFFSERAKADRTVMMLLGHDERGRWLRVALATVHIALRDVPVKLTADKIQLAVERAAEACQLLGLPRARVAVCGLNPHCGEGGEFGDEEPKVVAPAIAALKQRGLDVVGPISGDTVFHHALLGEFDAVVAMYHDQGLAPLKTVAFDTGINWTLGLPFIRTSPDHGTAYNIAGRGVANPSSMISALRLAKQLAPVKKA
jgi:4-hydroxythreonine-4-phosphate dehydrogenase